MPQDLPPASASTTVPTYLQYASQPHHEPVYDIGAPDFMTMIPGMSYANPQQGWSSSSSYESDLFGASAPVQQCSQPVPHPSVSAPQPQLQRQSAYGPATPTTLVPPPSQMPQDLAIRSVPNGLPHPGFQHQLGGPFRPSAWELEPNFVQATSQVQFQTSIFRKYVLSHPTY